MSSINDIVDLISFKDELRTSPKHREFRSTVEDFDSPADESESIHFEPIPERRAPEPEPEPSKPYDAEKNAKNLVNLMTGMDQIVLSTVYGYRANKKAGGRKSINDGLKVDAKQKAGMELTNEEKEIHARYLEYEAKISKMVESCGATPAEKQVLQEMAVGFMQEVQWEIGNGWTFFMVYVAQLGVRVRNVIVES